MGALVSFSSTTYHSEGFFFNEWYSILAPLLCVIHAGWQPRELRHRGPALLRTDSKLHGLKENFFFRFCERATAVRAPVSSCADPDTLGTDPWLKLGPQQNLLTGAML